jgi:hypothetical protein
MGGLRVSGIQMAERPLTAYATSCSRNLKVAMKDLLSKEEIKDKAKVDALVKAMAVLQIS